MHTPEPLLEKLSLVTKNHPRHCIAKLSSVSPDTEQAAIIRSSPSNTEVQNASTAASVITQMLVGPLTQACTSF